MFKKAAIAIAIAVFCAGSHADPAAQPQAVAQQGNKAAQGFSIAGISIGMTSDEALQALAMLGTGSHRIRTSGYGQKAIFSIGFEGEAPYGKNTRVEVILRFEDDILKYCDVSKENTECTKALPSFVTRVELSSEDQGSTAVLDAIRKMFGEPTRTRKESPPSTEPVTDLEAAKAKAMAAAKAAAAKAGVKQPPAPQGIVTVYEWCLDNKCGPADAQILIYRDKTATLSGMKLEHDLMRKADGKPEVPYDPQPAKVPAPTKPK